jgi:hypothetical protein
MNELEPWDEGAIDDLPPRPRSRFLRPLPMGLIALLLVAVGLLAGVELEKGQAGSSSSPPAAAPFALAGASTGASAGAPALAAAGGASGTPIIGTVASLNGGTLYVTGSQGNTLKVRAGSGSTVTRTSKVGVRAIHPGDSVVIQGSTHGGTVTASSVRATAQGASAGTAGFAASAPGSASAGSGATAGGGGSVSSLFGN